MKSFNYDINYDIARSNYELIKAFHGWDERHMRAALGWASSSTKALKFRAGSKWSIEELVCFAKLANKTDPIELFREELKLN